MILNDKNLNRNRHEIKTDEFYNYRMKDISDILIFVYHQLDISNASSTTIFLYAFLFLDFFHLIEVYVVCHQELLEITFFYNFCNGL